MDVTHGLVHAKSKNVAVAATGKGMGDSQSQVPSGMPPIYVPREERNTSRSRDNPPGRAALTSPAAAGAGQVPAMRSAFDVSGSASATPPRLRNVYEQVFVAAIGKEARAVRPGIFVPDEEERRARTRDNPSLLFPSPAAATSVGSGSNSPTTAISDNLLSPRPRHKEPSPSRPVFTAPPPAYPVVTTDVGSNDATIDDSEEDLQSVVAARRRERQAEAEANASRPVSASPSAVAAGHQSPATRPTGGVGANSAPPSLEAPPPSAAAAAGGGGAANAIQSTPTAPATVLESGQNKGSFCDRLLSCFGLFS